MEASAIFCLFDVLAPTYAGFYFFALIEHLDFLINWCWLNKDDKESTLVLR